MDFRSLQEWLDVGGPPEESDRFIFKLSDGEEVVYTTCKSGHGVYLRCLGPRSVSPYLKLGMATEGEAYNYIEKVYGYTGLDSALCVPPARNNDYDALDRLVIAMFVLAKQFTSCKTVNIEGNTFCIDKVKEALREREEH